MRAIIIHGLDDAQTALRAAEDVGRPVLLISGPGGAGYGGAAWFDAVVRQARAEVPDADATALLDCGDAPGLVLGALRHGLKCVRFTGPPEIAAKLADIAAQHGAELVTGEVATLDPRAAADARAACRAFLSDAHD
jgi:hypothetical protein